MPGNPATLHLEKLWPRDVTIATGLVDTFTAPTLVRLLSGRIDASIFVAQRCALEDILAAYDTFGRASEPSGPEQRSTSAYELRTPRLP